MARDPKAGLWAVIMAGGSGTRFWPESRRKNPKQYLSFFSKKSLIEETIERLSPLISNSRVLIVTQQDKVAGVRKMFPRIPASQIIGEPAGRNTAPCAVLAAALIEKKNPGAVMALLPADHRIENKKAFLKNLKAAAVAAKASGMPVTFGMKPLMPHTGYGYLEMGGLFGKQAGEKVYRLKRFHEKPSMAKAKVYFKSKKYLWNSGMFVWKTNALLGASAKHLPKACQLAKKIITGTFSNNLKKYFRSMPSISIDYGLMEKMKGEVLTIPSDFGWSDVGSWHSIGELFAKDKQGNVSIGKSLFVESSGNIVKSKKRLVALLSVKDMVVVDTDDALLVCPKLETESIRKVTIALEQHKLGHYL